jgi:hypothetical protein
MPPTIHHKSHVLFLTRQQYVLTTNARKKGGAAWSNNHAAPHLYASKPSRLRLSSLYLASSNSVLETGSIKSMVQQRLSNGTFGNPHPSVKEITAGARNRTEVS